MESCIVCCQEIDNIERFLTIGKCNHTGCCSLCTLRMRELMENRKCVICKAEQDIVICCGDNGEQSFEQYNGWGDSIGPNYVFDEASRMFFMRDNYEKIENLRKFQCPKCDGGKFLSVKLLKAHLSKEHQVSFCSICLEHKQIYIQEQCTYSSKELKVHHSVGKPLEGFKGHPMCDFCKVRFYSNVELFHHLTHKHYECDICEKVQGVQYRYYKDYDDLENHFRDEHYFCEEKECLLKKFVVFRSLIEFKAHVAQQHPTIKQSNKIDVAFHVRRQNRDGTGLDTIDKDDHYQMAASTSNDEIKVADFPALAEGTVNEAHLWTNRATTIPKSQDFPSLQSVVTPLSNNSARFKHALVPQPTASLSAFQSDDPWHYPAPANGTLRKAKGKSKNKNKKMPFNPLQIQSRLEDLALEKQGQFVEKQKLLISKIASLIGEQSMEEFKTLYRAYKSNTETTESFYTSVKAFFNVEEEFCQIFPEFISQHDNEQQRRSLRSSFDKEFAKKPKAVKPNATKPQARADHSISNALSQYMNQPTARINKSLKVGNVGKNGFKTPKPSAGMWASSTSIQQPAPAPAPKQSPVTIAPPHPPMYYEKANDQPIFKNTQKPLAKSDFPSLPKAGPVVGRQPVSRFDADEKAKVVELTKKGKKKRKNKMGLGEFAQLYK